ncbi:MAG: hypothetical protein IKI31_04320, partial [Treponema sp.]|nr:hypothetical protein [Treponema sp.]
KDELVSNLGKYISNEMVSNFGKNSFTTCLQVAPSNVRNMVTQTFAVDPIEGLRYAIVYHVWKEFWDEDAPLKAEASSAEESTNGQKVTFTIDTVADPIESLWIEEQGNWRLVEFSTIKAEKEKKSATKKNKRKTGSTMVDGVELTEPYRMQLAIGLLYPFESKKPGFEFQLLGTWHYAAFGLFVQMQKANVLAEVSGLYETYEMRNINMISFGPVFRLQVPVAFHKFCLTPYGDIRLGFSNMGSITKDEKTSRLYVGAGGGLSFAFNVNENVAPFLSAGYVHSIFKPLGMSKNVSSEHTNAIVISLGVKVIER